MEGGAFIKKLISSIIILILLLGVGGCSNKAIDRIEEYTKDRLPLSKNVEVLIKKDKDECLVLIEHEPSDKHGIGFPMGLSEDDYVEIAKELNALLRESGYDNMILTIYVYDNNDTIEVIANSNNEKFTNYSLNSRYDIENIKK